MLNKFSWSAEKEEKLNVERKVWKIWILMTDVRVLGVTKHSIEYFRALTGLQDGPRCEVNTPKFVEEEREQHRGMR